MPEDYFTLRKKFLMRRGLGLSSNFRDRFNIAINKNHFCSQILRLNETEFKKFHYKVKNVFERLDSIGFALFIMQQEEKAWERFIKKAHNPNITAHPLLKNFSGTIITAEMPTSLAYAFETFLFFADSYFEYLSRAMGSMFNHPNEKYIAKLINHIKTIDDLSAKKLVDILNKYHSLWEEMQVDGQRPYFENIEPFIKHSNNGTSLRDVAGHYQALKMSAIQMSISPWGEVTKERLQAGAFKIGDKSIPFGDFEKGIVKQSEKYLKNIVSLQEEIFDVFIEVR